MKDPLVASCARQFGNGYGFGNASPMLKSFAMFDMEPLFQGVVECRHALQRYPDEPSVIVYNVLASTLMAILILGVDAPDDEGERLARAKAAFTADAAPHFLSSAEAFYLGQAYAYGAGVEQDLRQALIWYGRATDKVSAAEREAIRSAHPEINP